jgi:PAS domain S-box-containing protein
MQRGSDDARDLRRCVRDLVALSTLPAVWANADSSSIARGLAEVLLRILAADFIYVRLARRDGTPPLEALRTRERAEPAVRAREVGRSLEPWLRLEDADNPPTVPNPVGDGTLRLAAFAIGHGHDHGLLAAGCGRPDFPTDTERLLLGVAVNQAAGLLRRKEVEEDLRRQSEWQRVTLASIGDAVITTDTEGRVTSLNAVAESLTGWAQPQAQGQPLDRVFRIIDERTRRAVEDPATLAMRESRVVGLANDSVLVARDGSERPIEDSAAPIKDDRGKTVGVVLVFRDVSERKRVDRQRSARLAATHALNEAETVEDGVSGVLRAVCENVGWDAGFFWTMEAAGTALACTTSWHTPDAPVDELNAASRGRALGKGEGLPGRVWATGQPAWILDVSQDANFPRVGPAARHGLHSAFACPVIVGDEPLGVIEFFTRRILEADAGLLEMMGTVAGNIGQFIERKAAETELRRSEQDLADFFDNATVGLHWVGPDGTILRANKAELDMLGYPREAYVGRHIADFHADEDVIGDILLRLEAGERLSEYPARMVCRDGSLRDVLIDSSVMRREGQFAHSRCFTRDVTERKRAEAAVKASAERLNLALSAAALGDWSWEARSDVVTFSERAAAIFGIPPGPHMTWTAMQGLLHPDDRGRARREVERAVAERTKYDIEYRVQRPDGSHVWVAALGRAIYDGAGAVQGMYGVVQDVTGRKHAEAALRHSEESYRSLMEQAPFSTQVFSPDGRTIRVNRAWEELWGVRLEQIEGYNILEDRQLEARGVLDYIRQGFDGHAARIPAIQYDPNETIPGINQEADPRRWLSAVIYPIKDAEGRVREVVLIHEDITARRRAEEELRRSEQRTRTILESITDAFCALDRDWRFTYVNRQAEVLLRRSRDELLGRSHWDEYPETLGTDLERHYRQAAAENVTTRFEYFHPPHDRWYEIHAYPSPEGLSVYFRDVSERKRAEIVLRETEERFRQLADAMPQIVWTAGPDGHIDYLNRRWTELSGLPQTAGNDAWGPLLHPDEAPQAGERWADSVRTGAPFEMELRLLDRRRGGYLWHLVRTVAVHDEAGAVARWFGTGTDIHEQKRAAESSRFLAQASAELASVVDYESTLQKVANLAVPYFADWSAVDVADPNGGLRRLAVAHQDADEVALVREVMRDYPPDPHAPVGAYAVLRTGRPEFVAEITDDLLASSAKDERHLRLIRSLGLRSYICVPLVVSGNSLGVLTFATSRSGRRYTEADLALALDLANRAAVAIENTQLYQALRETDRRKDEFLATLAHELRNPLAPIRNSLQILEMPRLDPETAERARSVIERQVHHLVRLVDDLLDVSRVMRGRIELHRERVELATVVAGAVETVQPLVDAQRQQLSVRLPPDSMAVDADPVRLVQVLGNLLTNAAKYTDPGGRIALTAERDGPVAVVRVRDDGIGIAPDMLPKIFDLFVQVDHAATRSQGGLGIGLTLVKNLVEMHNGTIEARSEGRGRGSEFVVRLPLAAAEPVGEPGAQAERSQAAPRSGYRLLVADDNQDAADTLAMLLGLQGHEVRVAYSGVAALEMTKDYRPDAVFLDIGMPGMDGYEVARRLRQQPGLEGAVLAALTGWGQHEDRRRSAEAGFDHHLVKPPEPQALDGVFAALRRKGRGSAS